MTFTALITKAKPTNQPEPSYAGNKYVLQNESDSSSDSEETNTDYHFGEDDLSAGNSCLGAAPVYHLTQVQRKIVIYRHLSAKKT